MGHLVTADGLRVDSEKVEGLCTYIGFVNYLAAFLSHLSDVIQPLRNLAKKDVLWSQQQAFNKVAKLVSEKSVLAYYDTGARTRK